MAISSVGINPSVNPPAASSVSQIVGKATSPVVDKAASSIQAQPSTIVTLSAQGQKLSQSAAQTSTSNTNTAASTTQTSQSNTSGQLDTIAMENVESAAKESTESISVQPREGETKGGNISTFA
jgi:hypothetical protein